MSMYMNMCFALFVCLTLLASFFLPSHLSFKNMYMYMCVHQIQLYTNLLSYRLMCTLDKAHVHIRMDKHTSSTLLTIVTCKTQNKLNPS